MKRKHILYALPILVLLLINIGLLSVIIIQMQNTSTPVHQEEALAIQEEVDQNINPLAVLSEEELAKYLSIDTSDINVILYTEKLAQAKGILEESQTLPYYKIGTKKFFYAPHIQLWLNHASSQKRQYDLTNKNLNFESFVAY